MQNHDTKQSIKQKNLKINFKSWKIICYKLQNPCVSTLLTQDTLGVHLSSNNFQTPEAIQNTVEMLTHPPFLFGFSCVKNLFGIISRGEKQPPPHTLFANHHILTMGRPMGWPLPLNGHWYRAKCHPTRNGTGTPNQTGTKGDWNKPPPKNRAGDSVIGTNFWTSGGARLFVHLSFRP